MQKNRKKKKTIKMQDRVFCIFAVLPFIIRACFGLIWVETVRAKIKDETQKQIAWQKDFPNSNFNRYGMTEEFTLKSIRFYKEFLTIYIVPEIEYHSTQNQLQIWEAESAILDIDDFMNLSISKNKFIKPPFGRVNLKYLCPYDRVCVIQNAAVVLAGGNRISLSSYGAERLLPEESRTYNPYISGLFFLLYVVYFIVLVNVLGKIFEKVQEKQTGTSGSLIIGD